MKNPQFAAACLALLLTACANAQAGPGPGMRGGGMERGRGPCSMASGPDMTTGWELMTAEERTHHRQKLFTVATYDECVAYTQDHRQQMEARAKAAGKALPTPRGNACDRLKASGWFN